MARAKRRIKHAAIVDAFGRRLRELRTARGMTQRALADQAKVTLSYVSTLESGGAAPGLDLLERLAQALRVSLHDLLGGSTPPVAERNQLKHRLAKFVETAGEETVSMLSQFLDRLEVSPASAK